MDKNTLSNYGWIIIAVLVLAVMIALATPFGTYIENGVKSTTAGLFDTSEKALNVVGMSAGNGSFGSGDSEPETLVAGATFTDGVFLTWEELALEDNRIKYGYSNVYPDGSGLFYSDNRILDLQGSSNLESMIIPESITHIDYCAFFDCENLTFVSFTNNISFISEEAFDNCISLKRINFVGTCEEWNNIDFPRGVRNTFMRCPEITVTCTDGTITIPAWS